MEWQAAIWLRRLVFQLQERNQSDIQAKTGSLCVLRAGEKSSSLTRVVDNAAQSSTDWL